MFIDRQAADKLKALMSVKGYTVRSFAQLTGNSTAQIQRLRLGNTTPRDCNFDAIFALLPEFKTFLEKQQAQKLDAMMAKASATDKADPDGIVPMELGHGIPASYGTRMCPVAKEWQVLGPNDAPIGTCPFNDTNCQRITPEPYWYSGEPSIDGLYAFQLEHNSGEPKIPYGAAVYVEWNASFEVGWLYLFVNDEQPDFGYLYRQTASDTFVVKRFTGEEVAVNRKDFRGRVIAWAVRA